MTGIFTGIDYTKLGEDASDINWYRDGKFEDPTRFLSPDQLQKVYLFIKNMNGNLDAFEQKINSQRGRKQTMNLNGFKQMSRQWEDELRSKGGGNLRDKGPIAKYGTLECPFSLLFKSDVPVYLKPDFTFTYTNDGDYKLIESTTPAGYNTITPIEFTISADHAVTNDDPTLISLSGNVTTGEATFTANATDGSLTTDIVNKKGSTLPSTGGIGTTIFYVAGCAMVVLAGVMITARKKAN